MADAPEILAHARARRMLRDTPSLVRDMRIQAGLVQQDVAEVLGVSRVAVSRWERGVRLPTAERAAQFLALLRQAAGGDA